MINFQKVGHRFRDGFRERGALGHLSFWGPMLVWPIWSLVLKTWKYAPLPCITLSKFYLLWCRHWFHDCLKSSTEIELLLHSSQQQMSMRIFLEFVVFSCKYRSSLLWISVISSLYAGLFFGYINFSAGPCCRPRKHRVVVDLISCT